MNASPHSLLTRLLIVLLPAVMAGSGAATAASLTIVGFGDSITQGVPYINFNPNGAQVGGYEPVIEELFLETINTATVLNYGVAGEFTTSGVGRISGVLGANPGADNILILEGVNDIFNGISGPTTLFNLTSMVQQSKAAGITPIIGTITPYPPFGSISSYYNPSIFGIAASEGIAVADLFSALNPNWAAYQSGDNLHPNIDGYQVMAEVWCLVIAACQQFPPNIISTIGPLLFGN